MEGHETETRLRRLGSVLRPRQHLRQSHLLVLWRVTRLRRDWDVSRASWDQDNISVNHTYPYCGGSRHRSTLGLYWRVWSLVCATFIGFSLSLMAFFKSAINLSCIAMSWQTCRPQHHNNTVWHNQTGNKENRLKNRNHCVCEQCGYCCTSRISGL